MLQKYAKNGGCSIAFIIKYRAFSGVGFVSWITRRSRLGAVMQLFVPIVFILNSNYRAFQLDRVKQSGLDSYINRRAIQPVFHPSRKNWFPGTAELVIRTDSNKQAKDAYTVYRHRYGIGAIEDKIEINESSRDGTCMA